MPFRNYCKFSCTSGSACPRAYGGRSRPRGPGDEDELSLKMICFGVTVVLYFVKVLGNSGSRNFYKLLLNVRVPRQKLVDF